MALKQIIEQTCSFKLSAFKVKSWWHTKLWVPTCHHEHGVASERSVEALWRHLLCHHEHGVASERSVEALWRHLLCHHEHGVASERSVEALWRHLLVVQLSFVQLFCSKIMAIIIITCCWSVNMHVCMYRSTGSTRSTNRWGLIWMMHNLDEKINVKAIHA